MKTTELSCTMIGLAHLICDSKILLGGHFKSIIIQLLNNYWMRFIGYPD